MNILDKHTMSKTIRYLLYVLIFFQPFNHFNSFREISFYGLLLLFLIRIIRHEIKIDMLKDPSVIAMILIIGWSLIVSVAGPFPMESLNAVRKNLLKHVVIFLIIISEFKDYRDLKPILFTVVFSFSVVTFASVIENAVNDWDTFLSMAPSVSWRSTSNYFFANYSDNATFYLPFIAGWLVSAKEVSWGKWVGILTLIFGAYLVYIYNARTQLLAVVVAIFISFLLTKRYKVVAVFALAGMLCLSLIFTTKNEEISRYKTLLNPETYTTDEGLTNRLGLWQVVIEFIEERPISGYGYGWKKLAWLVQEKDSDEYWKGKLPSAYDYYVADAKLMYGKVNPHNLALQIAFEIGLVGLAVFVWLWITILAKHLRTVRKGSESEGRLFMLASTGVVLAYFMVNITNGFWQENYGMMMFLFMALIFVIHREPFAESS